MPFLKIIKESYTRRMIENSKRNGLRHAIFSPKNKVLFKGYYRGEWKDDKKAGRGKELYSDGSMYEGDWLNNKRHGCGILSKILTKDNTIRYYYIGQWVNDKKHGFGHRWFEDGSYYKGDFWKNKRQGYGYMWYCNGDYYEGDWKNDLYDGTGTLVTANGNRYVGQFVKGKKEGRGIFYHTVTGQEQHGFWENDSCVNATMIDAYWRQSAPRPTPYPIPRVHTISKIIHIFRFL
uniref:MORN repeat-containing protein 3-like n=1 Tax=Osmia lignaria TaxID=473952 RepID=UPI0014789EC6|nr:MORN repeat-containing protein 3-like [Osmia lignaria]